MVHASSALSRAWLQLEWNALQAALAGAGEARTAAARENALALREGRRATPACASPGARPRAWSTSVRDLVLAPR